MSFGEIAINGNAALQLRSEMKGNTIMDDNIQNTLKEKTYYDTIYCFAFH